MRGGCRKVSYPSEGAALAAKKIVKRKRDILLRAYQCPHCRKWHLGNSNGTRSANLDRAFAKMHEKEGWV